MTQSPVGDQTLQGFEPPTNTQFSVFLDNRVGKLLDLLGVFRGQALTLAGMNILDSVDHAVVRILTSRAILAERLLRRHGLPFSQADVLVIELAEGRTLDDLCEVLVSAELNIHYAYPLLVRPRNYPAIVLHGDDIIFTAQLLRRKLFTLLGENDLGDNASRSRPDEPDDPSSN